jgi:hypothetical protein
MLRERAMARFAIYVRMLTFAFGLDDVRVTIPTSLVARIVDGACSDFSESGSTVMSILTEGFRYEQRTYCEERNETCEKNGGQPKEMT